MDIESDVLPHGAPTLGEARHAPELAISQSLVSDAGTLHVHFVDLQVHARVEDLGVAQQGAALAIPVGGEPGTATISVLATIQLTATNGSADFWLATSAGETRLHLDSEGTVVVSLVADIAVPCLLRVALGGVCWATKSDSFALLCIDSLGVIVDRAAPHSA